MSASDLELLRRFEPVIRYTAGEMFFPCAVEGYLARCSLWLRNARGDESPLLARGAVTPAALAALEQSPPGSAYFLRFVDEPLAPLAYQAWLGSDAHPPFSSTGRLSRVGFGGRTAEALFAFSLLLRGRVPGGTTARAQQQYAEMREEDPRYVYYGRVLRQEGYTILHYLFFYAMNDWRSSFHGVNDHESDWEQIFIYLGEEDGQLAPQWVAFAAHDFSGDDLRRRWDDPELQKEGGDHVVVFAGAGSHAAYVQPGEYLMEVEPEALKPARRVVQPARRYLVEALTNDSEAAAAAAAAPLLALAFVDYARGDGLAIGPGQAQGWSPQLLGDDVPWVAAYRGLWGLDTHDPLGGERAPAGPKYGRDGGVRQSWHDPLGWSGLDKVPAPGRLIAEMEAALVLLDEEAADLAARLAAGGAALRAQALGALALTATADLGQQSAAETAALAEKEAELAALAAAGAALQEKQRLLGEFLARARRGERGDPQAHLREKAVPQPPARPLTGLLDFWASISGALLMIVLILLLALRPPSWPAWIVTAALSFGLIEAAMRGKAVIYLMTSTIILAVISAGVLLYEQWRVVVPALLLAIFGYALLRNLRELRARRRGRRSP